MKTFEIEIKGAGSASEIVEALETILTSIKTGEFCKDGLPSFWEDRILVTRIGENR